MAIGATAVWEVRTTGSDSNGAFYTSGGVDYSQQDNAELIVDGSTYTATCSGSTITVSGATLTTNYIGNGLRVTGGSGQTQGYYQITAVNVGANTITLDRSTGGGGLDITFRIGGAAATPGIVAGAAVAGNTIWIKAGTYTLSSSSNVAGGRITVAVSNLKLLGYNATRGDATIGGTRPTLKAGANSMTIITNTTFNGYVANLIFDGDKANRTSTVGTSGNNAIVFENCLAKNCTGNGFGGNATVLLFCEASGNNLVGITVLAALFCNSHDNAQHGFQTSVQSASLYGCLSHSNTLDGLWSNAVNICIAGCTFANNGSDGAEVQLNGAACIFSNSIFYGNGGYGLNHSTTGAYMRLANCAFGGNGTAAKSGTFYETGTVTLTADPFTNSASDDYSLLAGSTGATQLKAAGTALLGGGISAGYPDIGAYQLASAAGGVAAGWRGGFHE